jgi:hypothetical protein
MPSSNMMIMKKSILVKSLLIAASLPLLAGCIVERPVRTVTVVQPAPPPGAPPGDVVVTQPENPPPPQVEVVTVAPGPLDLWFWVPGCWEWRGHWVWAAGRWAPRPHPHAIWVGGHWGHGGRGYVWVGGHWR